MLRAVSLIMAGAIALGGCASIGTVNGVRLGDDNYATPAASGHGLCNENEALCILGAAALGAGILWGASELFENDGDDDGGVVAVSDMRLKQDIRPLGVLENGVAIYAFRYLWDERTHVGVMAQDLIRHAAHRDAVYRAEDGFYRVDYAALGLRMTTLDLWDARGHDALLAP